MSAIPLVISIPAWTKPYVELATKYTIPSVIASLEARKEKGPVRFLLHTDLSVAMQEAVQGYDNDVVLVRVNRLKPDSNWVAFKQAHRDALNLTPDDHICVLLNSDIVCSIETFSLVNEVFKDQTKKVIASVGIRTLVDPSCPQNIPPVGVDAKALNRWIWNHQHPITRECVWQGGRSHHPTILFFKDGENVSMRCFHLTPTMIRKDRAITFRGTIDDDVLEHYSDDEVYYPVNSEFSCAELSPKWKTHPYGLPLTVDGVMGFRHRRARIFRPSHIRNFKQRFLVLGEAPGQSSSVENDLIRRLGR